MNFIGRLYVHMWYICVYVCVYESMCVYISIDSMEICRYTWQVQLYWTFAQPMNFCYLIEVVLLLFLQSTLKKRVGNHSFSFAFEWCSEVRLLVSFSPSQNVRPWYPNVLWCMNLWMYHNKSLLPFYIDSHGFDWSLAPKLR